MHSKLADPPIFDSPIDMLRQIVAAFNQCREFAIDTFTIQDLLNIYLCWMRCGWDIYPDEWTDQQIKEAKQGICPDWSEGHTPVYAKDRSKTRKIISITVKEKTDAHA